MGLEYVWNWTLLQFWSKHWVLNCNRVQFQTLTNPYRWITHRIKGVYYFCFRISVLSVVPDFLFLLSFFCFVLSNDVNSHYADIIAHDLLRHHSEHVVHNSIITRITFLNILFLHRPRSTLICLCYSLHKKE